MSTKLPVYDNDLFAYIYNIVCEETNDQMNKLVIKLNSEEKKKERLEYVFDWIGLVIMAISFAVIIFLFISYLES